MKKLQFSDGGTGKTTLVFLHFFAGSSNSWNPLIDILRDNYRCIAVDLCGFGGSGSSATLKEQTDLVLEFLKDLSLEDFILVGHSMGGKIALNVAARQPAHLKSLVLIAPSPPAPEPMEEKEREKLITTFGDHVGVEELVKKITAEELAPMVFQAVVNDHLKVSQAAWKGWLEEGTREDISGQMMKVSVPAFVISGSEDENLSTRFLKAEFTQYFPDAGFAEVNGAGHLVPLEKPEETAELIASFTAGINQ